MTTGQFALYHYRGELVRALDGDTIEVNVSLGMHLYHIMHLRIAGINAPEVRGDELGAGVIAALALTDLLKDRQLYIRTHKDGRSFARFVGDVFVSDDTGELIDVAARMVVDGYAVRVER